MISRTQKWHVTYVSCDADPVWKKKLFPSVNRFRDIGCTTELLLQNGSSSLSDWEFSFKNVSEMSESNDKLREEMEDTYTSSITE